MIYFIQIYLIIVTTLLAFKDATSYLLKTKEKTPLVSFRVKRWHFEGILLNTLIIMPLFLLYDPLEVFIAAILIRMAFFDPAFNVSAQLPIAFLGTSATSDTVFGKMFGVYGAVRKMIFFSLVLLLLNLYKIFIQ